MTGAIDKSRMTLAVVTYLLGLSLAAASSKLQLAFRASLWTLAELAVSLVITVLFGIVAVFVTHPRSLRLLDLTVSRGLEVTAALPLVLVCAVVVTAFGWRMPYAVALVVGALNGLMCLRMMSMGKSDVAVRAPYAHFKRAFTASVGGVVPQLVGLEAAVVFLRLFDFTPQGGLGQPLGTAVSDGNFAEISTWSLIIAGISVGAQQRLRRPTPRPLTSSSAAPADSVP